MHTIAAALLVAGTIDLWLDPRGQWSTGSPAYYSSVAGVLGVEQWNGSGGVAPVPGRSVDIDDVKPTDKRGPRRMYDLAAT